MEQLIKTSYLKFVLVFLQFCGISTISINHHKRNRILVLWSCCTLVFLLNIIHFVYIHKNEIFFSEFALGQFIDALQFIGPVSTHITLLIVCLTTRNRQKLLWDEIIAAVDILYKSNPEIVRTCIALMKKKILREWFCLFCVAFGCETKIMIHIRFERSWSLLWYTTIFSFVMIRMGILYYIIFVNAIEMCLIMVNEIIRKDFKQIRNYRQALILTHRANKHLNGIFGLFLLIYQIQLFFSLTIDLFWICIGIVYNSHTYFSDSLLCPIPPIIALCILYKSCNNLHRQVCILKIPIN